MKRQIERLERYAWRALGAIRDRGFTSRLRVDPAAPAVVLSPHLDDAVINCWSLLTADRDVTVVNVFTASPPQGRWRIGTVCAEPTTPPR